MKFTIDLTADDHRRIMQAWGTTGSGGWALFSTIILSSVVIMLSYSWIRVVWKLPEVLSTGRWIVISNVMTGIWPFDVLIIIALNLIAGWVIFQCIKSIISSAKEIFGKSGLEVRRSSIGKHHYELTQDEIICTAPKTKHAMKWAMFDLALEVDGILVLAEQQQPCMSLVLDKLPTTELRDELRTIVHSNVRVREHSGDQAQ